MHITWLSADWLLCGRVLLEDVLEHGAGTAMQWRFFFLPGGRNRNDCWLYYLSIASKNSQMLSGIWMGITSLFRGGPRLSCTSVHGWTWLDDSGIWHRALWARFDYLPENGTKQSLCNCTTNTGIFTSCSRVGLTLVHFARSHNWVRTPMQLCQVTNLHKSSRRRIWKIEQWLDWM